MNVRKVFWMNSPQTIRRWKEDLVTLTIICLLPEARASQEVLNICYSKKHATKKVHIFGQLIFDIVFLLKESKSRAQGNNLHFETVDFGYGTPIILGV